MTDTPTLLDGTGYDDNVPLALKQISGPSGWTDDIGAAVKTTNRSHNTVYMLGTKPSINGHPEDQADLTVTAVSVDTGSSDDYGNEIYSSYKLSKPLTLHFNQEGDDPKNGPIGAPTPDSMKVIQNLTDNASAIAPQKNTNTVPVIEADAQGDILTVDGNKFVPKQSPPVETLPPTPKAPEKPAPGGAAPHPKEVEEITATMRKFLHSMSSVSPTTPAATPSVDASLDKGPHIG